MIKTLSMQFMRYVNLFNRVTRISTNHCFEYNNAIVFAVPRRLVSRALGHDNVNLRRLNQVIGRKVKIVAIPYGREDIENFVSVITYPVRFKAIEIKDDGAVISAGPQSKAILIGRNKVRLNEMQNVLGQYFGVKRVVVR